MAEPPPNRNQRTELGLIVVGVVLFFAAVPAGVAAFYAFDPLPTLVMVVVDAMGPVGLLLILAARSGTRDPTDGLAHPRHPQPEPYAHAGDRHRHPTSFAVFRWTHSTQSRARRPMNAGSRPAKRHRATSRRCSPMFLEVANRSARERREMRVTRIRLSSSGSRRRPRRLQAQLLRGVRRWMQPSRGRPGGSRRSRPCLRRP